MMNHIRQFDWCATAPPCPYYIEEPYLDESITEKIIANRFIDPLVSSDEDEPPPKLIDWDTVFKINDAPPKKSKVFVPGLRPIPPYPKKSALTDLQHQRGLRVVCSMNPKILKGMYYPRPNLADRSNFEKMKEEYDKEKKEYIEWAKTLWIQNHCVRALRPKPTVESVYEAEFQVRAQRLTGYPKHFDMAAQIPLECTKKNIYEATLMETLIEVNIRDLPHVTLPEPIDKLITIIRPLTLPEPCHKHPYQFVLPTENSVSMLPITEIHRELAQYAADHDCKFIASENALRCLMEFNRHWTIPVSVYTVFNTEGGSCNVVVLDSEFSVHKEPAICRTLRAYRHLLEHALIPSSERERLSQRVNNNNNDKEAMKRTRCTPSQEVREEEPDLSSDDESMGLFIMEEYDGDDRMNTVIPDSEPDSEVTQDPHDIERDSPTLKNKAISTGDISMADINDIIGVYNCTCSDTPYEKPPRRSFKKWQVANKNSGETVDVIIHCSHKAKLNFSELIMEPVPEYQLELGGSEHPPDRIRSLALSLMLRKNACVLKARVDGSNGDLVTLDTVEAGQVREDHREHWRQAGNVLHTALSELQGLVPGHYVLRHEPGHFANALLYVARPPSGATGLELVCDSSQLLEPDEAKMSRAPPTIAPVLLPYHKYRNILPCAFSPYEPKVPPGSKKPPGKQKTPPQAIQNDAEPQDGRRKVSMLRITTLCRILLVDLKTGGYRFEKRFCILVPAQKLGG